MNFFKIQLAKLKVFIHFLFARKGLYRFSFAELSLYYQERYKITYSELVHTANSFKDLDLIEIEGKRIYWPSSMAVNALPWLYREVFSPWASNPSSYDHPAMNMQSRDWVIDAGACEGFFSCFAFEKGAKRLIAVEPMPSTGRALLKTFENIRVGQSFELVEGGLGAECGVAFLDFDPLKACESNIVSRGKGESVEVLTLDKISEEYFLGLNGMIKMDIEGAEMSALEGGKNLLREKKPALAIAVYHGYDNAMRCRDIIMAANPKYTVEFRGMYCWSLPARPYLLFAW